MTRDLIPASGHCRERLPRHLRVARLARVAVERIEHDGVGTEEAQLFEVVDDLVDVSLAGEPPRVGDR